MVTCGQHRRKPAFTWRRLDYCSWQWRKIMGWKIRQRPRNWSMVEDTLHQRVLRKTRHTGRGCPWEGARRPQIHHVAAYAQLVSALLALFVNAGTFTAGRAPSGCHSFDPCNVILIEKSLLIYREVEIVLRNFMVYSSRSSEYGSADL